MPVTHDQAQQLAALACAARPTNARRWDAPGVLAAIGKVKHLALADVALAVMRAADDRHVDTPGVIGNPRSPCWQERATDRPTTRDNPPKHERCSICSLSHDRCRQLWSADHDFEAATVDRKRRPDVIAQIVEATKAEIALTKPTETEETPVRDHDTCEEAINAALANGNDGQAEFLAARCDREHGDQTTEGAS